MFANAYIPSSLCSCIRLLTDSCGTALETNDELLLVMLFFGFLLFRGSFASFTLPGASAGLDSPNRLFEACHDDPPVRDEFSSLSAELSVPLEGNEDLKLGALERRRKNVGRRGARTARLSFVPAVGGADFVSRTLMI